MLGDLPDFLGEYDYPTMRYERMSRPSRTATRKRRKRVAKGKKKKMDKKKKRGKKKGMPY